jgi:hypothetical protein
MLTAASGIIQKVDGIATGSKGDIRHSKFSLQSLVPHLPSVQCRFSRGIVPISSPRRAPIRTGVPDLRGQYLYLRTPNDPTKFPRRLGKGLHKLGIVSRNVCKKWPDFVPMSAAAEEWKHIP